MRIKKSIQELNVEQLKRRLVRLTDSKEKVSVLLELGSHLFTNHIDEAIRLFHTAYSISTALNYQDGLMRSAQKIATYYINIQGDIGKAVEYNTVAEEYARKLNDEKTLSLVLRIQGVILAEQGHYLEGERTLKEAELLHKKFSDTQSLAYTYLALGDVMWKATRHSESRQYFDTAYEYYESINDRVTCAAILHNISVLLSDQGKHAESIIELEKSIEIKQESGDINGLARSFHSLGVEFVHIGDYENALEYFLKSLHLKEELHIERKYLTIGNIGYVYSQLEQYQNAYEYYQKAYHEADMVGDMVNAIDYQIYSASVLSKSGLDSQALAILDEIEPKITAIESNNTTINYLQNKASLLRKVGHYLQALELVEHAYNLSVQSTIHELTIQTLCARAELNADLQHLEIAKMYAVECIDLMKESGSQSRMADALGVLRDISLQQNDYRQAYLYLEQQSTVVQETLKSNLANKIHIVLVQFEVERIKKDAQINQMKVEQLEKELSMKQNELTALALHLVNKNEFLVDLREQITENIDDTNQVVKNIAKRINANEHDESDWLRFEQQFVQIHPEFSKKLMEKSNNALTPTELKICTLIKTGLASQEIANVLFLSKRTVENHRYNIHKKLELGNEKLVAWLAGT